MTIKKIQEKRAIIVDDHKLFTNGLSSILKSIGLQVAMAYDNGKDALSYLKSRDIDVVFSDINMPEMDGIQFCKKIREQGINTKVIMLSMYEDPNIIDEAFECGADAYLSKNTEKREIEIALETCFSNQKYIGNQLKNIKKKTSLDSDDFIIKYKLTAREKGVLDLMLKEVNNKEISKILNISMRTVETHRSNIYLKLGVKSSLGLGRVATKYNLFNSTT